MTLSGEVHLPGLSLAGVGMDGLDALRARTAKAGLDAVALVPGPNFKRLFGRDFHLMERAFIIIVPVEGKPIAIVPDLEMTSFNSIGFDGHVFNWRDEDGYDEAFAAAANALPSAVRTMGLEAQRMRVFEQMALQRALTRITFSDAHADISSLRLIKTPGEIADLKKAIAISEAALEATLAAVRIGQTEKEIEAILMRELFAHGADGLAFEPIVAAAGNSAEPHASARDDYALQDGDALLIDFGATWNGMNADITRTFFAGSVSEQDRAFYDTVLAANKAGRAVTKAGVTAHDVDDAVQRILETSPYADYARHKTGHGLGLDVHEAPQIMRGNHTVLEAGMVFTVEPGLYRVGECGVRIEDDVVVTDDGIDCLTAFPRDLRIVGQASE